MGNDEWMSDDALGLNRGVGDECWFWCGRGVGRVRVWCDWSCWLVSYEKTWVDSLYGDKMQADGIQEAS
jgi:hypothetical protein